jgi:hypothetical protein
MVDVYKSILVPDDPATTIERFVVRRQSFFETDYEDAEQNRAEKGDGRITVYTIADTKIRGTETVDVVMHSLLGIFYELAVISGGKNVQTDIQQKGEQQVLTLTWN